MTYEEAFEFLDRTAKGIAQMFGSSCETLVHDMSVPDHPILSIYNGHVSGREVGSTMDIMGVGQDLDEEARKTDFVNLYATTPAGQQIKSSTFHMMSDEYNLALGINFDYSSLVFANRILVDLMRAEEDLKSAIWRNGENRLGEILDECLAIVGKPVGALNKADRIKVIALLNQREAFSFRKAVPFISQRLGVSRYTVYKYLSEIAEQKEELHESMEARDRNLVYRQRRADGAPNRRPGGSPQRRRRERRPMPALRGRPSQSAGGRSAPSPGRWPESGKPRRICAHGRLKRLP